MPLALEAQERGIRGQEQPVDRFLLAEGAAALLLNALPRLGKALDEACASLPDLAFDGPQPLLQESDLAQIALSGCLANSMIVRRFASTFKDMPFMAYI